MSHRIAAAALWALTTSLAFAAAAPRESQCVRCHSYAVRRAWLQIVPQWKQSIHAAQGVGCEDCHGGNPRAEDFNDAMYRAPGFKATWAKRDIPALCARCHSDPAAMRPYNLPTHQYDQYRQSVHGRRLLEQDDPRVAACTDCHGVHEIRAPDDPKSTVFKTNIPRLCARCHADKTLMARYGLAGDEYAQYVKSVHGQKLLEEGDRAAPACPDCHGTHGATPPGVQEVPAVCGHCHGRTQRDFEAGPHSAALEATGKPRCVDCHGDHGIQFPSDAMLVGSAQGHCGSCHAAGSKGLAAGTRIHAVLTRDRARYRAAVRLVNRARDADMDVSDLRAQLEQAQTSLTEARALQHTVSTDQVEAKTAQAARVIAGVERGARGELADARHRRNLILGAVLVFLFGACVLWLKRRQVMAEGPVAG